METVPKGLLISMALGYDLATILNFCLTSKRFNSFICQNNNFWMNKTLYDYGQFGHVPKILNEKYKKYMVKKLHGKITINYYIILEM